MRNLIWFSTVLGMLALPVNAAADDPNPSSPAVQSAPANRSSPLSRRNPPTIWDSTENGHSQISIVEPGRLAFMSGQVALRRNGKPMPRDLAGQAQMVAANLAAELDDVKASPKDIVSMRMYVVNATNERFMAAWAPIKQRIGGDQPSLTAIGVQALWTPEVQLEVEMIVRVP